MPGPDALAVFLRPKVIIEFDMALNAVAYAPLGAIACLVLRGSGSPWRARAAAVAACAAFSLVMESLQFFVTGRVASLHDVVANTAGAFAGTLLFAGPVHALVTHPLAHARERLFAGGGWGDAGLVLGMKG